MAEQLEKLVQMIKNAKRCTVFTGAGVSTMSGIRDFRGKNGVYSQPWQGYSVEEILSLPFFMKDPKIFYAWAKEFCYRLDEFDPNIVHLVLAKMEEKGYIKGVYTQNIDLLHQKAGSKHVWEIHGSPSSHYCLNCRKNFSYEEIAPLVMRDELPKCDKCGGYIKPRIIFYGENLDTTLLEQAFEDMERSDLTIVLGSSLTVQPAASMPLATFQSGGKVVIVNAQPTPYDMIATLKFNDLREVFEYLDKHLF